MKTKTENITAVSKEENDTISQNISTGSFVETGKKLFKEFLICLAFVLIWGLVAHGYMLVSNSVSHDALHELVMHKTNADWKISLGRIFVPAYMSLTRGIISIPWLVGIMAFLFVAAALLIVCKTFEIKSNVTKFFVAGILIANVSMIALTASFIEDLDGDMLAMLFATLSVLIWRKNTNSKWKYLLAGIPLVFSLGLYQSYVSVAITLIFFVLMLDLVRGKNAKEVLFDGLKAVAMIAAAAVVYVVLLLIVSRASKVSMEGENYNSLSKMTGLTLGGILKSVLDTYAVVAVQMVAPLTVTNKVVSIVVSGLLLLIAILASIMVARKNKIKAPAIVLCVAIVLLLPLAMNVSRVLSGNMSHELMYYAIWLVYLFELLIVSEFAKNCVIKDSHKMASSIAVFALLGVILFGNVVTANTAYTIKRFEQDANLSLMTRIVYQMEHTEGYKAGETEIVIIGRPTQHLQNFPAKEDIYWLNGMYLEGFVIDNDYTTYYSAYFKQVLMNPAKFAPKETGWKLREHEEVQNMPTYPESGAMKFVDGILVIKLG